MTDIALEMPWLTQAWTQVQQRYAEDRLPHALIVTGERGVGKRAWAETVAGLLLCESPEYKAQGEPIACGRCKQCELLAASSHPDLRIYAPEKSRMVKVDQVRALTSFAVASPQVGHHKVAIIDRGDQLNINAANALLKTLEEPLPDVTLLLLQESGRPLLPTIRSRCQTLTIPMPSQDQANRWLVDRVSLLEDADRPSAEVLAKALMLSGNAPRLALEYATGEFISLRDEAFERFKQFMKGQIPVGEAAKSFKALGLEDSLWLFEGWSADLARLAAGGQAVDTEAGEMLSFLAARNPPWRAHELLDLVKQSREAGVYNANPELEASRLLIAWQRLMPVKRRSA
ncbi:DNA polymerase III subunit delta' [Marinobacter salinexigens]|uniref:DNA-directed DNA polymerase n=1 Tax=Marinobacter salinexigens TaxID=2919747 RepID=A0A5B0VLV6_9GAMM|nr:DNA polymerase III subunit delta' [Marinobacter salinexigens]KAA1175105.1 DNA polymerase III subunit delta' [Marinobacter salinexigens]